MTLRIGITGTMGSGKSTVAAVFAALGAPIYDSDSKAKALMAGNLRGEVESLVGCSIDNKIEFAERLFGDKNMLKALESIVHPAVVADFLKWSSGVDFQYAIIESALLLSSPYMIGVVEKVVGVICPVEVAIERAIKRDNLPRDKVLQRMARQISTENVVKLSDFLIVTDEKELIVPKILALHNNFCNFVSV